MIIENKGAWKNDKGARKNDFDALSWTLQARPIKQGKNPILDKLLIDDNFAVCTDGSRLHMAQLLISFDPGIYDVISVTKKMIIIEPNQDKNAYYLDYNQLFKEWKPVLKKSYNGYDAGKYQFVRDIYCNFDGTLFDLNFLTDAYCGYSDISYAIGNKTPGGMPCLSVYNETLNRCALIMSIKE